MESQVQIFSLKWGTAKTAIGWGFLGLSRTPLPPSQGLFTPRKIRFKRELCAEMCLRQLPFVSTDDATIRAKGGEGEGGSEGRMTAGGFSYILRITVRSFVYCRGFSRGSVIRDTFGILGVASTSQKKLKQGG